MHALSKVQQLLCFIVWEYKSLMPYILTLDVLPTLRFNFSDEQLEVMFGKDRESVSYIETIVPMMRYCS